MHEAEPGIVHPQHRALRQDASKEMKDENGLLMSFCALATALAYLLQLLVMLVALQVLPGSSPAQNDVLAAPMAAKLNRNFN